MAGVKTPISKIRTVQFCSNSTVLSVFQYSGRISTFPQEVSLGGKCYSCWLPALFVLVNYHRFLCETDSNIKVYAKAYISLEMTHLICFKNSRSSLE